MCSLCFPLDVFLLEAVSVIAPVVPQASLLPRRAVGPRRSVCCLCGGTAHSWAQLWIPHQACYVTPGRNGSSGILLPLKSRRWSRSEGAYDGRGPRPGEEPRRSICRDSQPTAASPVVERRDETHVVSCDG